QFVRSWNSAEAASPPACAAAAATTTTPATTPTAAPATTATSAAAPRNLHTVTNVFLVEEVECRQADVGQFFFAKGDCRVRCEVPRLRHVRVRYGRCCRVSHEREGQSGGS